MVNCSIVLISMYVIIVMMLKVISNGNKGEKKKKIFLVENGRSLTGSQAMEHLNLNKREEDDQGEVENFKVLMKMGIKETLSESQTSDPNGTETENGKKYKSRISDSGQSGEESLT